MSINMRFFVDYYHLSNSHTTSAVVDYYHLKKFWLSAVVF